jgi:two-component system, NtrC family, nitrogen regulation response regulator GlnG
MGERPEEPEAAWGWEPEDHKTTRADASDLHRLELANAELEVLSGRDAGTRLPLGAAGLMVGSGKTCDLRLFDEQVSRRHLELCAEARGVRITDLGSLNGTYLDGVRIERAVLLRDAMLSLGATTLAIRIAAEPIQLMLSPRRQFGRAVGASEAMRHVFALLEQAAQTDVTVLFEGDSGTGKDILAQSLHERSARADGPFVVVDCAALPEHLVESELFGHERGAFTGATERSPGRFEQAQGGTLFLDEIGDMPPEAQTRLLRVLQQGEFTTVGGRQPRKADVRIVAATHQNLKALIAEGRFREDLYYRLAVVPIRLPPLRERTADLADLARHFLRRAVDEGMSRKSLTPEALDALRAHSWPGNVRELENLMRRLAVLCPEDRIPAGAVTQELAAQAPDRLDADGVLPAARSLSAAVEMHIERYFRRHGEVLPPPGLYDRVLREVELPLIALTLAATRGNQLRAADLLGINRNTLRKKIRELDIPVTRGRKLV